MAPQKPGSRKSESCCGVEQTCLCALGDVPIEWRWKIEHCPRQLRSEFGINIRHISYCQVPSEVKLLNNVEEKHRNVLTGRA